MVRQEDRLNTSLVLRELEPLLSLKNHARSRLRLKAILERSAHR